VYNIRIFSHDHIGQYIFSQPDLRFTYRVPEFKSATRYLNDGYAAAAYYGRKAMGGAASVSSFEGIVDGEWAKAVRGISAWITPRTTESCHPGSRH
jgi:hypothetical protein